jgi:hypothetical protein
MLRSSASSLPRRDVRLTSEGKGLDRRRLKPLADGFGIRTIF